MCQRERGSTVDFFSKVYQITCTLYPTKTYPNLNITVTSPRQLQISVCLCVFLTRKTRFPYMQNTFFLYEKHVFLLLVCVDVVLFLAYQMRTDPRQHICACFFPRLDDVAVLRMSCVDLSACVWAFLACVYTRKVSICMCMYACIYVWCMYACIYVYMHMYRRVSGPFSPAYVYKTS